MNYEDKIKKHLSTWSIDSDKVKDIEDKGDYVFYKFWSYESNEWLQCCYPKEVKIPIENLNENLGIFEDIEGLGSDYD